MPANKCVHSPIIARRRSRHNLVHRAQLPTPGLTTPACENAARSRLPVSARYTSTR